MHASLLLVILLVAGPTLTSAATYVAPFGCPNKRALRIIVRVSNLLGPNANPNNEAKQIQANLRRRLRGNWGVLVMVDGSLPNRRVFWTIPGRDYCTLLYGGWFYNVFRM